MAETQRGCVGVLDQRSASNRQRSSATELGAPPGYAASRYTLTSRRILTTSGSSSFSYGVARRRSGYRPSRRQRSISRSMASET
jgi:hypothetical protein